MDWWNPGRASWSQLALLPNVVCKLSGVISEADHDHWNKDQVRPDVEHVLDCFGFERVMYGSDWTVSELTHRYPDWVAILDEITAGSSGDELRKPVARHRDQDLPPRRGTAGLEPSLSPANTAGRQQGRDLRPLQLAGLDLGFGAPLGLGDGFDPPADILEPPLRYHDHAVRVAEH